MKETSPQFHLRLPDELRAPLQDAAGKRGHSLTAEILERLRESLVREGLLKGEGMVRPRYAAEPDTRELIVMMELMTNQLDLMRKEMDARMKGLKSDESEPS